MEAGLKSVRVLANRARKARSDAEEWREAFHREIRTAAKAGATHRALAEAAGLSFQRIGQILSEGD